MLVAVPIRPTDVNQEIPGKAAQISLYKPWVIYAWTHASTTQSGSTSMLRGFSAYWAIWYCIQIYSFFSHMATLNWCGNQLVLKLLCLLRMSPGRIYRLGDHKPKTFSIGSSVTEIISHQPLFDIVAIFIKLPLFATVLLQNNNKKVYKASLILT